MKRDKNNPVRILITGSRNWHLYDTTGEIIMTACKRAFIDLALEHQINFNQQWESMIMVSGGCPTGADKMAEHWIKTNPYRLERYPADWETHGKRAGFIRNAEMVNAGADLCLAFIKDSSAGASMTLKLAEKQNIPTRVYTN